MRHHLPVEAIAAEIHEAAAAAEIGTERIECLVGVVFRMLSGQDDGVFRQQIDAFGVDVVIGDDLEVDALAGQEVGDRAVG